MPAVVGVEVEGLEQLQNAFRVTNRKLGRRLESGLVRAAAPVRQDAESLAVARIPTVGFVWSRMRVGVMPGSAYVAPRARGTRLPQRKRPRFAGLLMSRAMQPALNKNLPTVERIVGETLDRVNQEWASA